MKRNAKTKKTELNNFNQFKIKNPKLIFGGNGDGGGPIIERGRLKKPGRAN